jgi:hypothetical protein
MRKVDTYFTFLEQGNVLLESLKLWRFLNPFESVNIVESISICAARHYAGRACLSAPCCLAYPSPSHTPHRVGRAHTASNAPRCSPLLRDSAAAHAWQSGAIAGCPVLLTAMPGGPSHPSPSATRPHP